MIAGTYNSLGRCWIDVLKQIWYNGQVTKTEYGNDAKYVLGVAVEIIDWQKIHPFDPFATPAKLAEYCKQFERGWLESKHGQERPEYTYMDRFVHYPVVGDYGLIEEAYPQLTIDQLADIRHRFSLHSKGSTRRAQMITWIPELDNETEHPPCLQRVWFFKNPLFDSLDVHISYRSWDFYGAFESNVYAICNMVNREVATPLGYELGDIRCFGDNVHIYDYDWPAVEECIRDASRA